MNLTLGATYLEGSRCQFVLWAPLAESVKVWILDDRDSFSVTGAVARCSHSGGRLMRLQRTDRGYREGVAEGVRPGTRCVYCLDWNLE
jgi:1,4-alpha-glucan branching enzyme